MKRYWIHMVGYIFALCAFLIFAACDTVTSDQPMGATPKRIEWKERQIWEGIWLDPGGGWESDRIITVRVMDGETGVLQLGALDTHYRYYNTCYVFIREAGGYIYANVTDGEKFQWVRLSATPNYMLIWFPRTKQFEQAVNSGLLPGVVIQGSSSTAIHLMDLTKEQLALINEDEQYFEGPTVLIKVGSRVEPLADRLWLDD